MVKKYIIIILFTCALGSGYSQVKVKAFTDSQNYQVGDRITYTLQVSSPDNINILTTGFKDSIANLEIISANNPITQEKDGNKITTYSFSLTGFDSVDVTIPPVPVFYKPGKVSDNNKSPLITPEQAAKDPSILSLSSNPVSFAVRKVKVDSGGEIRDVKEPVKLPLDWKIIALWILGGLLVLGIIYYLYRKYWKKKEVLPQKKIVFVPPHIIALKALKELEEKKLWQNSKVKEYHSEITEIVRRYFEDRFNLPALELTTSEAMLHLRNTPGAEKITDITYDFLTNADLVKFAKYTPMNIVNEEMLKQAYDIINTTIPLKSAEQVAEVVNV